MFALPGWQVRYLPGRCQAHSTTERAANPGSSPRGGGGRARTQRGSNLALKKGKHRKSTRRLGQRMGLGCRGADGLELGGSARAPGWGVPLLHPLNLAARVIHHPGRGHLSPDSDPPPPRLQPAPATTRRNSARGSATRGFGGTGAGDEAQGTAMADAAATLGEKGLRAPCAPSRARRRLPAGLRAAGSGLCSAVRMLRPPGTAGAAAAATTAATSGAAAAVAEAAVGRFPFPRLLALAPAAPRQQLARLT